MRSDSDIRHYSHRFQVPRLLRVGDGGGGVGGVGGVFQDPMGIREILSDSIGISSNHGISYMIHRIT